MSRMTEGRTAPTFVTEDHLGAPVSLAALRGRKVLLSFYRYASCPLCNLRVNALIRRHAELQKAGLEMIAVFQSPEAEIRRYVGRQETPFPIVADPSMTYYRRFSVETSWAGFFRAGLRPLTLVRAFARGYLPGRTNGPVNRVPADFLIDEDGRFSRCYYGRDADDHLPIEAIVAFAKQSTTPTWAAHSGWHAPQSMDSPVKESPWTPGSISQLSGL